MIRNVDTAFQLILLAATLSVVWLAPTKCRLGLSTRSATLNKNGNFTVLCNASCFGVNSHGMFGWFDKTNNKIPNSGRIFSMTYNRGRYARLFIRNFTEDDAGVFVCSKIDENERVDIPFKLNGGMVNNDLGLDSGPERGDIHSNEFEIPDIRSVRSVRARLRRGVSALLFTTISPGDGVTEESQSGDTAYELMPQYSMPETTTVPEPTNQSEPLSSARPKSEPTSEGETEPETEAKPEIGTNVEAETKQDVQPDLAPTSEEETEPETEAKPEIGTNVEQETKPDSEPEPAPNNGAPPNKGSPEKSSTTDSPTPNASPNTEFGRRGLIAFVLTLAVAILLFYALMLTICIPRCLARRKAMDLENSRKAETGKKEGKNIPEAIKLSKIDDNGVPSPGPSDSGFTTIDLDEQTDKKGEQTGKKDEETAKKEEDKKDEQAEKKEETTVVGTEQKPADAGATADVSGQLSQQPTAGEIKEDAAKSTDESLLDSILQASGEKTDTKPVDSDIAFIDQTPSCSTANAATPAVVDQPQDATKTTEVKLDIVETDDGHKQIKLSTSMPPPPDDLMALDPPASDGDVFQTSDVNV